MYGVAGTFEFFWFFAAGWFGVVVKSVFMYFQVRNFSRFNSKDGWIQANFFTSDNREQFE